MSDPGQRGSSGASLSPPIDQQAKCAWYRPGTWVRILFGGLWRFLKVSRIRKNVLRFGIVRHRLGAELSLHFTGFAVLIGRVFVEDMDLSRTCGYKDEPRFRVIHLSIGPIADGE